jgi:predicted DNA-binding transcriptional regulator YafY
MPPLAATRQFEIIAAALALAEERHGIPLLEAAASIGVPVDQLRTLLEPVLYLEFRDGLDELIDGSRAYFLDSDRDVLQIADRHWLRDWDASTPSPDVAVRLFVAATVYQATASTRSAPLDQALAKLRQVVAIDMVVPVDRPPALEAADAACRAQKSLRFRYTKYKDDIATDREVFPFEVYGSWGHWYVAGPEVDDADKVYKHWRVERMDAARIGDLAFDPPDELPEHGWFDLTEHQRRVTVRLPAHLLAALPQPHAILSAVDEPGGIVRAELQVAGDRHLDHLLTALGPDGEVLEPLEYAERRRQHARALLDRLETAETRQAGR